MARMVNLPGRKTCKDKMDLVIKLVSYVGTPKNMEYVRDKLPPSLARKLYAVEDERAKNAEIVHTKRVENKCEISEYQISYIKRMQEKLRKENDEDVIALPGDYRPDMTKNVHFVVGGEGT